MTDFISILIDQIQFGARCAKKNIAADADLVCVHPRRNTPIAIRRYNQIPYGVKCAKSIIAADADHAAVIGDLNIQTVVSLLNS